MLVRKLGRLDGSVKTREEASSRVPMPFWVKRMVEEEVRRWEIDLSAETVLIVLVAMMRLGMSVSLGEGGEMTSTSKWPLELMIPLVVIEIFRPA